MGIELGDAFVAWVRPFVGPLEGIYEQVRIGDPWWQESDIREASPTGRERALAR